MISSCQQSTYQAVLLTNGTDSYIIYSYEDGGMEWTRRIGRKCAVGYATKDRSYSYEEEDSFRESIFSIDTKEFEVNGVRRQGFFCKSLNAPDAPVVLTDEQKCMSWYNQEPDPKDWLEELGDCPATRTACRRDNQYRRVTRSWRIECYELKFATPKYGASHRCCYHRRGRRRNAFVGEPPSAGRAYRLVFLWNEIGKYVDDLIKNRYMKRSHYSIFSLIIGSILKAFSLVVRERFRKDEFALVH